MSLTRAQQDLIIQHQRLILWLIHQFNRRFGRIMERDEIVSSTHLGAVLAAQTYDPTKGTFSTYAAHNIKWILYKEAEAKFRQKRKPGNDAQIIEYDDKFKGHHAEDESYERIVDRIDIERLQQYMSEDDEALLHAHFIEGLKMADIGRTRKLCRERIRQKVQRALERLNKIATFQLEP